MAEHNHTKPTTNSHQGAMWSYAVGFLLSLVFTLIPYYLVTQKILTGTTLLLVVLGFAIVQMFVQMFFFLHLGRGPKPFYNIVFFAGTAGMIILVVGASLIIMNNLYRNMAPMEVTLRLAQEENIAEVDGHSTGACQENKDNNANHMIMIKNDQANPGHLDAKRCDTLTFMSDDNTAYKLAFGTPDNSVSYGGMFDVSITPTRSKTITLNEAGDFSYYNQSDRSIIGHFTVKP